MLDQKTLTSEVGMKILGELHAFAEELGNPAILSHLSAAAPSFQLEPLDNPGALRHFLQTYYSQVLVSCEMPAIYRAYNQASRSEIRDLIATDRHLMSEPILQPFASASQQAGTTQLKRLRPLRGDRLVQRYWQAVENGKAFGWHTVVYGLVLSLYSIPLRQGLLNYGEQTLHGLILSASHSLKLDEQHKQALHSEFCRQLPSAIESILEPSSPSLVPSR